jgi:hypothetical protein
VKKIRATEKAYPWVTIHYPFSNSGEMTLRPGDDVEVINEEILVSPEVEKAKQEGKIEIIGEDGKLITV